jgi:hypothetical protein
MASVAYNTSALANRSATARRTPRGSSATGETATAPAAGSIIQRGILRSTPSGPRTVMGRWGRETPPRLGALGPPAMEAVVNRDLRRQGIVAYSC